jgi:uncharacterized repeat protein (TIGR02543 family)
MKRFACAFIVTIGTLIGSQATVLGQTTEIFESFTPGATSFTSGSVPFTLTPSSGFSVAKWDGWGYLSSNQYIDNLTSNSNPCQIKSTTVFTAKSLYLYPSIYTAGNFNQTTNVNVTFTGKLAGVTKFTYTPPATDFAAADYLNPTNRGFSLVNFATPGYDNTAIDELDITLGGATIYFAIDNFTWRTPAATPTVTNISPSSGPAAGGTSVTITGTNFTGATAVTFGAVNAASYTVNSATNITAVSPAGSAGTVHVTVTTAGGTSATSSADQFTYVVAPTITTQAVTAITNTTATGNGNIVSLGSPNPTAYGICWGTNANPTTADGKVDKGAASATGVFTVNMAGLSPNTTYHVRAFATNTAGTVYGADSSFTTLKTVFTLTTNAVNGSITKVPNAISFDSGTIVQLTALPASGYTFTVWNGDITGTVNPANMTMNSNKTITANFELNTYLLTVNTTAGGTIGAPASSPVSVSHGVSTAIAAVPQSGYTFINWTRSGIAATISDSTAANTSVVLTGNSTVTANFSATGYSITYTLNGGINNPNNPLSYTTATATITLADPVRPGYTFNGWFLPFDPYSRVTAIPTGSTGDIIVAASWTIKKFALNVTASNGTVTRNPSAASYDSGAVVQLTAAPGTGYSFVSWTGDISSFENPVNVTVDGNKNIMANFSIDTYSLSITAGTGGTIAAPSHSPVTLNHGDSMTITALPDAGYSFTRWTRSSVNAAITDSTHASTSVKLTGPATVTAMFSLNPPSTPVLLSPAAADTIKVDSAVFVWNEAAPAITEYRFEYAVDSEVTAIRFIDSTVSDTTITIRGMANAAYYWRVQAKNAAGWGAWSPTRQLVVKVPTTSVRIASTIPREYAFSIKGRTGTFEYALPQTCAVSLKIYNVNGRLLESFERKSQAPGYYSMLSSSRRHSSGSYIALFSAGNFKVKKVFSITR